MNKLLQAMGPNHREMIKEAIIGGALRTIWGAGKLMVRKPLQIVGAGFTANDTVSGSKMMAEAAGVGRAEGRQIARTTM